MLVGFFVGFVVARVVLGRKSYQLGQAAAYASVESQLAANLAATQHTAQAVNVQVTQRESLPDGRGSDGYSGLNRSVEQSPYSQVDGRAVRLLRQADSDCSVGYRSDGAGTQLADNLHRDQLDSGLPGVRTGWGDGSRVSLRRSPQLGDRPRESHLLVSGGDVFGVHGDPTGDRHISYTEHNYDDASAAYYDDANDDAQSNDNDPGTNDKSRRGG